MGEYEFPDLQVTITLEGAGLHIEVPGQGKFPMFAEAEDRFFLKVSPALLTFTKNDTGVVTGALFGDELVGHKVR